MKFTIKETKHVVKEEIDHEIERDFPIFLVGHDYIYDENSNQEFSIITSPNERITLKVNENFITGKIDFEISQDIKDLTIDEYRYCSDSFNKVYDEFKKAFAETMRYFEQNRAADD